MNIYHQIYAATCKNRGFGVFYQSPEMSRMEEDTINVIRKNATYKEPYLFNSNTDIDKYPINYECYFVSNTGKARSVLAFSKYTGSTNHTPDRRGNFITHTVVFDDILYACHIPNLMKSIPFRNSLTIEEEAHFVAPSGTIEYHEESIESIIRKNVAFLKSDRIYLDAFLETIDIIMNGWLESKGKNITICAPTNQECIDIIFSVFSLLPPFLVNQFSFATYVVSPSKVSFQICGIIPECGVTSLDTEYFKLIKVNKQSKAYTPLHLFTKVLENWITNERIEKISNLEKQFRDYNIVHLDKSVELPFKIEEFQENISSRSLSDLSTILKCLLPDQKKHVEKLFGFISTENPKLFLEYKIDVTRRHIAQTISFSGHLNFIEQSLKELSMSCGDKDLLTFFKGIETALNNRTGISTKLLIDEYDEIRDILKKSPSLCEYLLAYIDKSWSRIDNRDKEDVVNGYHELINGKTYPNIQLWISSKEIKSDIREGTFLEKTENYHSYLSKLSMESGKLEGFFIELIEVTNKKGLLTPDSMEGIITLVKKYQRNPLSFWKRWFDENDSAEKDDYWKEYSKAWPISLIKRYYVYSIIVRCEDLSEYSGIIESLNEYETRWVLEKLIEFHHQEGHARLLLEMAQRKAQKSLFWKKSDKNKKR